VAGGALRTALAAVALATASASPSAQTTLAGSTPASFRVTESGAAEYRIPIRVPPGIAGVEPRLALVYNSQAGNGLLGVGWSLEGLSVITRCPRTMAQDGVRGGVNYNADDRFCLDGQRLIAISGTEYRTERESFSKIVSYGGDANGPAWFKVWTRSGQVLEYGRTDDARIEAQGKPTTVRAWAVNKMSDRKGNDLTVVYVEDGANGDYRPLRIDYGGNSSVQFFYEARSDIAPAFQAGSVVRTPLRLASARTYAGASLVKTYALSYDVSPATARSRLAAIQECDGAGSCLRAIALQNQGAPDSYAGLLADWHAAAVWGPDWKIFSADVNGDGRADFIATYTDSSGWRTGTVLSNGDGTYSGLVWDWHAVANWGTDWKIFSADVNGDGKADFIASYTDSAGWRTGTVLSNGDGTYTGLVWDWHAEANWATDWKIFSTDVNGDGKADFIASYTDSAGWRTGTVLSNGDGTYTGLVWNWHAHGVWAPDWKIFPTDIDGDGRADFVASYTDGAGWRTYSNLHTGPAPDVVSAIANGGASVAITYKPLTDPAVHARQSDATYPVIDLQVALQVVSSASASNGIGATITSDLRYGGLKAELGTGRGSLGFGWQESTDPSSGLTARTQFRQDWPYVGLPSLVKKMQGSGALLSEVANTYSALAAGNRYFPFVSRSEETGYDLKTGAALPKVTTDTSYDAYGNPVGINVCAGDGHSKSTTNTFAGPDPENWQLGLLTRSTVRSPSPIPCP
jgi:hypothetical protein